MLLRGFGIGLLCGMLIGACLTLVWVRFFVIDPIRRDIHEVLVARGLRSPTNPGDGGSK